MVKAEAFAHQKAFCSLSPSLPHAFQGSSLLPVAQGQIFQSGVQGLLCAVYTGYTINGASTVMCGLNLPLRGCLPQVQTSQAAVVSDCRGGGGGRDAPTVSSLLGFAQAGSLSWKALPPSSWDSYPDLPFKDSAQRARPPCSCLPTSENLEQMASFS